MKKTIIRFLLQIACFFNSSFYAYQSEATFHCTNTPQFSLFSSKHSHRTDSIHAMLDSCSDTIFSTKDTRKSELVEKKERAERLRSSKKCPGWREYDYRLACAELYGQVLLADGSGQIP